MVTLTNVGASYDAIAASQGLGMVELDFTGVVQLIVKVKVNKIGTGTQSWQLWNETDSTEMTVWNDAGGSGIKVLGPTTLNVSLVGVKSLRWRAKSTVSADDPQFMGFTMREIRG